MPKPRPQGVEPFNFSGSKFGLGSTAASNFGSGSTAVSKIRFSSDKLKRSGSGSLQ